MAADFFRYPPPLVVRSPGFSPRSDEHGAGRFVSLAFVTAGADQVLRGAHPRLRAEIW